jgi:branched-chain amino acid transport system substrate-binding protein
MNIRVRPARARIIPALVFFLLAGFTQVLAGAANPDTIKIGLLIPNRSQTAAYKAATLAINAVNRAGGINGHPVKIILKSMEGPWGTGSKQAVDLVFQDKVTALLGSVDGRNAHLVEQVAAKSKVPFISAWSSDPTLAQAFVPWFFNCVPGNPQQAESLYMELSSKTGNKPVILISDTIYDSESAAKNFLRVSANHKLPDPERVILRGSKLSSTEAVKRIKETGATAIVVYVQPSSANQLLDEILKECPGIKIYSSVSMLDENVLPFPGSESLASVSFTGLPYLESKAGSAFNEAYMKAYGTKPGPVAAYAFDAMNVLIGAVRAGGTGVDQIQKVLVQTKLQGVTGLVQFDERGSREGLPALEKIKMNSRGARE